MCFRRAAEGGYTLESRELSRLPISQGRERIIELLQSHYAQGNLDMEEFENRLDLVNDARTVKDLLPIISDLPDIPEGTNKYANCPVAINRGAVKESCTLITILSGNSRKGIWRPPHLIKVFTFMGGADLDFREAIMAPGTTRINIFCMMGGVDIKVPPGLNVEVKGFAIMGGIEDGTEGIINEEEPRLVIHGFAIMGGLEVKVKKKKG
jgi:hypothetical protein